MEEMISLSVVMPAHNEEESINLTVDTLIATLRSRGISWEIVVVDDHSSDRTAGVLSERTNACKELRIVPNDGPGGFGHAVKLGLAKARGSYLAIMMADGCDDPADLIRFYDLAIKENHDCVFGDRFATGGSLSGYPRLRLPINRIGNWFVGRLFRLRYYDLTNAFKLYRREALGDLSALKSSGFALTLELPLAVISRGCSVGVVPNSWRGRRSGRSKFRLLSDQLGYLAVIPHCLRERRRMLRQQVSLDE